MIFVFNELQGALQSNQTRQAIFTLSSMLLWSSSTSRIFLGFVQCYNITKFKQLRSHLSHCSEGSFLH